MTITSSQPQSTSPARSGSLYTQTTRDDSLSAVVVLPARQLTRQWRPSCGGITTHLLGLPGRRGFSSLGAQIASKTTDAEGKGKPLHYIPKTVTMKVAINRERSPCEPLSNRRRAASGAHGVKLVTGHGVVGDQALHGNPTTGISIKLRQTQAIGTWNVRGLLSPGKLTILEREVERCGINICGLSETHWKNNGHFVTDNHVVYFSGHEKNSQNGVAFLVPVQRRNSVIGYEPVSDRIISIKLKASPVNLNLVQIYAPTSTAGDEVIERFYSELETTIAKIPNRELLVILGDFNAKIGANAQQLGKCIGSFGLGVRNDRGDRLIQFASENDLVITNSFYQHHPRRLYTWTSPDGKYRNQIDYILVRSRWRSSVTNAHTLPGADCGSDHQLLVSKFKLKLMAARALENQRRRLDVTDIPKFKSLVDHNWAKWSNTDFDSEPPEELWNRAKSLIELAVSGSKTPTVTHKQQHWMTDGTFALVEERRKMKAAGASVQACNEKSAQIQRKCRQDHNAYLRHICEEIETHAGRYESRDLHHKIRLITKALPSKTWAIEDDNGQVVSELEQISEAWRCYCRSLFEDPQSEAFPPTEPESDIMEPDILRSEVRAAIKHLKNGRATGSDAIPIETIRALGERGVQIFSVICNKIWLAGRWPSEWAHTVFIPLHKKGSTKKCSNYRLIALISHASKILLHILNERLKAHLSKEIAQEQAGFVKGKGTREQIFIVRQVIEKAREFNKPTYICFVDFSKAFDSVKWPTLWKTLLEMGTPKHLVHLLRELYEGGTASVRTDSHISNSFHPSAGVRQGCIVSPLLFNIYTELIMRITLEDWTDGVAIGGYKIANLRYADDTTLFATSADQMEELLLKMERVSLAFGLKINRSKTKIMIVDRSNNNSSAVTQIANCDVVQSYIYLGAMIAGNGSCVDEVKRRMAMSRGAMDKLRKIWRNRSITKATKIRLIRALVFPIFLYAAETWTLRELERKKIDALEMWCWRRMLGISWTEFRTNVSILQELGIKQRLSAIVQSRILKFFGHVSRRNNDSIERLVVQGRVDGNRPRGRSPMRWTDQIKSAIGGPVNECAKLSSNRAKWREIVRRVTGTPAIGQNSS